MQVHLEHSMRNHTTESQNSLEMVAVGPIIAYNRILESCINSCYSNGIQADRSAST
jgi:hypothetical protein